MKAKSTKKADYKKQAAMELAMQELDQLYYPGYSEQLASINPEAFSFEIEQQLDQVSLAW